MKKVLLVIMMIVLTLSITAGCSFNYDKEDKEELGQSSSDFVLKPQKNDENMPYRIAIVDIDPYEPASHLFYNFVNRLWELGWIKTDKLPINEDDEIKQMVAKLENADLGGLIEFDEEICYYMLYEDAAYIQSSIKNQIESGKGIDLILGMGTDPGLFVKDMKLEVPLLVPMATDPVASGIIKSVDDAGSPYIWALVEPNPMERQLNYYNEMFKIKKLGMAVEKENQEIAAIGVYSETAEKLGIEIVKKEVDTAKRLENEEQYYKNIKKTYKEIAEEDIDAFLLTINVIDNPDYCYDLFEPFYEKKIPVLVSDGDFYVENGGLLCVSSYDYSGYGTFTADVAATVFNGKMAGSLSCEYLSSPHIVLNTNTAKKIDFPLSFKLLQSSDILYSGEGESENAQ